MLYLINSVSQIDICHTSHWPDECGTRPCFQWVQLWPRHTWQAQKYFRLHRYFPKMGLLRHQAINLAFQGGLELVGWPPKARGCWSWCTQHKCRLPGIHVRWSDGLNRLPLEPGHTRLDLCTNNTADWKVSECQYLSYVTPTWWVWQKALF